MSDRRQEMLRSAFAPARLLEPREAEVARVLARLGGAPRGASGRARRARLAHPWARVALPALAVLLLLAGGLYAVPGTRAALEDAATTVAETFGAYSQGDSAGSPGRPLQSQEPAPQYFGDSYRGQPFARDPRVLAEAGGYRLYAYRAPSGALGFDLGDTGVGMGFESPGEIGPGAIYILGPGSMSHPDAAGHVPLFGLAADSVKSVELVYASGPPLRVEGVDGGFVLLAEPGRSPQAVVGLNGGDEVVERAPVGYIGWDQFSAPSR
jgi:hypothetical protein